MTLENCKRLLAQYEDNLNNPSLTKQAKLNLKNAILDMKENLKRRGVQQDPPKEKKK